MTSRSRRDFHADGGAAMAAERVTASFAGGVGVMDQDSYKVRHDDVLFCFCDAYDRSGLDRQISDPAHVQRVRELVAAAEGE